MTPVEFLDQVIDLIRDETHWTKGASARTKDGFPTLIENDDAYSYCLVGSLIKVYGDLSGKESEINFIYTEVLSALFQAIPKLMAFHVFNDSISHPQLIETLKSARNILISREI